MVLLKKSSVKIGYCFSFIDRDISVSSKVSVFKTLPYLMKSKVSTNSTNKTKVIIFSAV